MRSQGAYFEGTEASLSYVQCFLYLVSSSINVSIFFILYSWTPSGRTLYGLGYTVRLSQFML